MNRLFVSLIMTAFVLMGVKAQTLNVVTGNVTYAFPSSQTGCMTYQDGQTLSVMGKTFSVSDVTNMYVDNSDVTDNTVNVNYNGTSATVTVAGNVARYVTPTIADGHVNIVQSNEVSDEVCGEITYSLTGTASDGEFALTGSYKATLELNGLSLTNLSGAPLNIQDGKRIAISVKKVRKTLLQTLSAATGRDASSARATSN